LGDGEGGGGGVDEVNDGTCFTSWKLLKLQVIIFNNWEVSYLSEGLITKQWETRSIIQGGYGQASEGIVNLKLFFRVSISAEFFDVGIKGNWLIKHQLAVKYK
jgi:hypothetical protein